jgi:hypothetical protein
MRPVARDATGEAVKNFNVIAIALAAVASGLGCKAKSTFVHVTLNPAQPEPSGIKSIELQLALGSQTATTTLREASGADIALPADTTLQIGSGAGQFSVTAIARSGDGREIDRGVTTATVVAGAITEVAVAMAGGKADLEPSEDHHDFGNVAQGQSSPTVNLSYINAGYKPTGTLATTLAGAGASAFSLGADNCSGHVLAPSASCSVALTFHPTTIGALAATVAVNGAPGGTGSVAVSGTGTAGTQSLSITTTGNGSGIINSSPAGLTCAGHICSGAFPYGTAVTLRATPDPSSSVVSGWTGCTPSPDLSSCVAIVGVGTTVTVTFALATEPVSVAFSGSGGGSVSSDDKQIGCNTDKTGTCTGSYTFGATVTLSATPASGSGFTGWSGGGCNGTAPCNISVKGPINVTANFVPLVSLALTFPGNGSGSLLATPGGTCATGATGCTITGVNAGTSITLKATTATGSAFRGFSNNCVPVDSTTCTITMTSDQTVTATFTLIRELVSVTTTTTSNATGSITSSPAGITCTSGGCSSNFDYGTALTLTATPGPNSSFTGWSGGTCSGNATTCSFTVTSPVTATATFVPNTEPLSVSFAGAGFGGVTSTPSGLDCTANCSASFAFNSGVTLNATAKAGSVFTGWSGDCSGTGACAVTMSTTRNVTANFAPLFALSVAFNGSGAVTSADGGINCGTGGANSCNASYASGTTVSLTANPATGFSFAGWSGACPSTSPPTPTCSVSMTQAQSVSATFTVNTYALSVTVPAAVQGKVNSSPAGISCNAGQTCSASFNYNTQVTLTATPAGGNYLFAWSGDCTGTATCAPNMTQARSVSATFHASFCASGTAPVQEFTSALQGCPGKASFANRATLCASNCRVATANEWATLHGAVAPQHHYWTDDALAYSSGGACGPAGCSSQQCFVTLDTTATVSYVSGTSTVTSNLANNCINAGTVNAQPMRVCAGTAADTDGNTCTWSGCGYNSVSPNQYFGGCSGANDATSGALCICGQALLFVDAVSGLDTNVGSSAAPFKTITHAMGAAASGQTVQVRQGTYDAANGETFPINVPAGVSLIGDETNRGSVATTVTRIFGAGNSPLSGVLTALLPAAGATIAGFSITSNGSGAAGVTVVADGTTLRNNTFTGSTNYGIYVNAKNTAILLDSVGGTTNGSLTGAGLIFGGSAVATKVENSSFIGNDKGLSYGDAGGDAGGGSTGSVGNNTMSCNKVNDVSASLGNVTLNLAHNIWDHAPPAQNGSSTGCAAGQDICTFGASPTTFVTTGALQLSSTPGCPSGITP